MTILSERYGLIARRAAYWALLGAVAGGIAGAVDAWHWLYYRQTLSGLETPPLILVSPYSIYVPPPLWIRLLPGALFGLVVCLELRRQGLAKWWQAAAFIALSAVLPYIDLYPDDTRFRMPQWFEGLTTGAILAAGAAAIFPFARRPGVWLALTAACGIEAWLVVVGYPLYYDLSFPTTRIFLGSLWYAVVAATLSTALPLDENRRAGAKAERSPTAGSHGLTTSGLQGGGAPQFSKLRLFLPRALEWAGLGAISGALAWGLGMLYLRVRFVVESWNYEYARFGGYSEWHHFLPFLVLPGLVFGVVAGTALWRSRLARIWQIAALAIVSVLAFNLGVWSIVVLAEFARQPESRWLIFFLGLMFWNHVQAIGTAEIFTFVRRRHVWFASIVGGLLSLILIVAKVVPIHHPLSPLLAILWMSWYAVHAAILSTALPVDDGDREGREGA